MSPPRCNRLAAFFATLSPKGLRPLKPPKVRAVAIVQARIVMAEPQGFLPPPACNKKKGKCPVKNGICLKNLGIGGKTLTLG